MNPEQIALHLIKEDLIYHQVVHHLAKVEVHLEHYPDFAGAVEKLISQNQSPEASQSWTDQYAQGMAKAREIDWNDLKQIDTTAKTILTALCA